MYIGSSFLACRASVGICRVTGKLCFQTVCICRTALDVPEVYRVDIVFHEHKFCS